MLIFYLSLIDTAEDKEKFEKLYNEYKRLMKYIANDILHDDYLSEDAVHEAFIRIANNYKKISDVKCHKTRAFVVIIVRRIALSMYAKRKSHPEFTTEAPEYFISEPNQELEKLIDKLDLEMIVSKTGQLSENDGQILMLKYIYDYDDRVLAKFLGIKDTVFRKRLERARKKLAVLLTNEGDCVERKHEEETERKT